MKSFAIIPWDEANKPVSRAQWLGNVSVGKIGWRNPASRERGVDVPRECKWGAWEGVR